MTAAQLSQSAARIFAVNDRLNQILIENLPLAIWNAKPPGNTRPISAIFSHIHNVRTKWIRLNAPYLKVPPQLNRARCTPQIASASLRESAARCSEMLAEALAGESKRIRKFRRDSLARPWPAGPEMLCYMLSHEAHHRGQICMLAHQLGSPLPGKLTSRLWSWESLWNVGRALPPANPRSIL